MDITTVNRLNGLLIVLFITLSSLSCGGAENNSKIDTNVEKYFSTNFKNGQGIYGQATFIEDFATKKRQYSQGFAVQLFLNAPTNNPNDGILPIDTWYTDTNGFYEIYIDEFNLGQYCVCTKTRQCIGVTVESGTKIRLNNEYNQAATWSYSLNKNIQQTCQ